MQEDHGTAPSGPGLSSSGSSPSVSPPDGASIPSAEDGDSYRLNPHFRRFMDIVKPVGLAAAAWQIARDFYRPSGLADDVLYEVWQDGDVVAEATGPRGRALDEAVHYAVVYQTDGKPCVIQEVTRREIDPDEAHAILASAMSARSAETEGLSPKDASAVGEAETPTP